jgi:neutral ceramidase
VPREGPSTGTHDPLYARALVLADERSAVALVAVDLVAVTTGFTAAVRQAVQEATGLPPSHVLLAASHTHAGPDLFGWGGPVAPEHELAARQGVVEAVVRAHRALRPARAGWSSVERDNLVINRRDPEGPIDPRVGVMTVEAADGELIALAVNYAIHTCMLSGLNTLYSGDISGMAMAALERFYPGAVALFLNGPAGNINPVAYPWGPKQNTVTAFRAAWHAGREHPRTFRNAARLGHLLAAAAIDAVERTAHLSDALSLAGSVAPVTLPLVSRAERERYFAFTGRSLRFAGDRLDGDSFPSEVQALRIGPSCYIGLPGEPFVELGLEIRRRLGADSTYVVGYANDDVRYVMPEAAFRDTRYDVWATMLAAGSGELLVENALVAAGAASSAA